MASVLTQSSTSGAFVAIQYALREMLRNSVEHSMCDKIVLFGQFWPAKNRAEIVIHDDGVGVRRAITESGENSADTTMEALQLALTAGVSGVSEAEKRHQHESWRNSGFGLYVTSRFCAERGFFRLISGDCGLTVNKNGPTQHDWRFEGTCLQMKIDTSDLDRAGDRILEIVKEGEADASESGVPKPASKSSKTVRA
jgi:hypothetical protein